MNSPSERQPTAPVPERRPVRLEAHGDVRTDDWYWLKDADEPAVIAHLEAENAYATEILEPLEELRKGIYEEMVARIEETDRSVPVPWGDFEYFHRTEKGKDYPIHCRIAHAETGAEEVLLDENLEAEGASYFAAANVSIRPDHQLLAFAVDTTGDERYELHLRSLGKDAEGGRKDEIVPDVSYGLAWAEDSVFYTKVDEAMRPFQVWRHRLGTASAEDVLVTQEDDQRFGISVGNTKDHAFVVIAMGSHTTSEMWFLSVDDPTSVPRIVAPRRAGVEYSVEHHAGKWVICTNLDAPDFRIITAPVSDPGTWHELVPQRPGIRIEDIEVFGDHRIVSERAEAETRLRVLTAEGDWFVPAEEHPCATTLGWNPDPTSSMVRFEQTSLATPRSDFDLDLDLDAGDRRPELRKRAPVLGGYAPLRTWREWVEVRDGTRVPVSLVHRADLGAGPHPCVLSGYGAYEYSLDPRFSSLRLSLLDRGFVLATAHVRGGGELGRRWYEDGKMENKPHSFSDFVDCATHLVQSGLTAPDRLGIRGGSAGGLLVGAALNMAPALFAAVVAEVPFVDCLTTMLDASLPLTITEWEEWGNPASDPEVYATMKSYSPYDGVPDHLEVRVYATAGLQDPRVGFWEPAKWTARLRASGARVVLRVEMDAGHGGPSGRYDAWHDEALVSAFLIDALTQPAEASA